MLQCPLSPAESSKEAERLKEVELEAEQWAEQSQKLQAEAEASSKEIAQLKQDRQKNQEAINRCVSMCRVMTSLQLGKGVK